jgi:hypothetical protein
MGTMRMIGTEVAFHDVWKVSLVVQGLQSLERQPIRDKEKFSADAAPVFAKGIRAEMWLRVTTSKHHRPR